MFECDQCGRSFDEQKMALQQVGGQGRICSFCAAGVELPEPSADFTRQWNVEKKRRREDVALAILGANFANPGINNPTAIMTVGQAIAASFRIADEFIAFSDASFKSKEAEAKRKKMAT